MNADHPSKADRPWAAPLLVAVVALLVRLLVLAQVSGAPAASMRLGDAQAYHLWAQQIAGGQWLPDRVFYQAPLYPYFLALTYRALGETPLTVKLVQVFLGAGACALLCLAGRKIFSPRVGLLAGLMLALYPPAIFFDIVIQKTSLTVALLAALIWVLACHTQRPRMRTACITGILTGLLALVRENALVFLPVLLAMTLCQQQRRLPSAAALLAGIVLVLAPVAGRHYALSGEFHLTTSQWGPNFYIGNNAGANGQYQPLVYGRGDAAVEADDARRLAQQATGQTLTAGQVSRYWLLQSWSYIRSQPAQWLGLLGTKLALALNAVEATDTEGLDAYADWSPVLRVMSWGVHFGVLLPVAGAGLALLGRDTQRLWIFLALPAVYLASLVMFYVTARYRMPLVPFLILPGAYGIVHVFERVHRPRLSRVVIVAVVLAVGANVPLLDRAPLKATTYANMGIEQLQRQRAPAAAAESFAQAIQLNPGYAKAHLGLGVARLERGDVAGAEQAVARALELEPGYADAWFALGVIRQRRGLRDEAAGCYERAIELAPDHVRAMNNLGVLLTEAGRIEEAIRWLTRAVRTDPGYARAMVSLQAAREQRDHRVGEGR